MVLHFPIPCRQIQQAISQRFQSNHDFETKLHPVQMVDYVGSFATGAGYIYVGVENVTKVYKAQNFKNQYDYMCMEKMLAHEITHNIEGHTLHRQNSDNAELKAEKGSVRLTDTLPEGDWGVYLVGVNRKPNRPEQNEKVLSSFGKEANGKIRVSGSDTEHVFYKASNGNEYPLFIGESISTRLRNANAYFGGQVAYCIAKGAFRPENIQIVPNNLRDIKFEGDYLLVCESPKLPNGYRVLADLFGDYESLAYNLNVAKGQVKNDYPLSVGFKNLNRAISTGAYARQSIEESYWTSWMACAIAQDNANR